MDIISEKTREKEMIIIIGKIEKKEKKSRVYMKIYKKEENV